MQAVRLVLVIQPGSDPIRGWVALPDDGPLEPFTGWIELTGRIEAARASGPPRPALDPPPGGATPP